MARKYQEVLFDGLHIGNIVRDVLNNLKIQQIEAGNPLILVLRAYTIDLRIRNMLRYMI